MKLLWAHPQPCQASQNSFLSELLLLSDCEHSLILSFLYTDHLNFFIPNLPLSLMIHFHISKCFGLYANSVTWPSGWLPRAKSPSKIKLTFYFIVIGPFTIKSKSCHDSGPSLPYSPDIKLAICQVLPVPWTSICPTSPSPYHSINILILKQIDGWKHFLTDLKSLLTVCISESFFPNRGLYNAHFHKDSKVMLYNEWLWAEGQVMKHV